MMVDFPALFGPTSTVSDSNETENLAKPLKLVKRRLVMRTVGSWSGIANYANLGYRPTTLGVGLPPQQREGGRANSPSSRRAMVVAGDTTNLLKRPPRCHPPLPPPAPPPHPPPRRCRWAWTTVTSRSNNGPLGDRSNPNTYRTYGKPSRPAPRGRRHVRALSRWAASTSTPGNITAGQPAGQWGTPGRNATPPRGSTGPPCAQRHGKTKR